MNFKKLFALNAVIVAMATLSACKDKDQPAAGSAEGGAQAASSSNGGASGTSGAASTESLATQEKKILLNIAEGREANPPTVIPAYLAALQGVWIPQKVICGTESFDYKDVHQSDRIHSLHIFNDFVVMASEGEVSASDNLTYWRETVIQIVWNREPENALLKPLEKKEFSDKDFLSLDTNMRSSAKNIGFFDDEKLERSRGIEMNKEEGILKIRNFDSRREFCKEEGKVETLVLTLAPKK